MKKWYVIHTQTGQEEKVKKNIEGRLEESNLKELFGQVLIPVERVSEVRAGEKKIMERKFFPGYILVEMEFTDEAWYFMKDTSGVTGFVGAGRRKPTPLSDQEIQIIIQKSQEKKEKPTPKVIFEKGENVKVIEGPFTNFNGIIDEVNPDKGKLKVMVTIFGRATPVELEYWQVEKQ